jgi:hypothetical protein
MDETSRIPRRTWIRSNRAVVATKDVDWRHLLALQTALQEGLFATPDVKRREFFEIEIDAHWYYIHIPSCITGIYLIDVRRVPLMASAVERTILTASVPVS